MLGIPLDARTALGAAQMGSQFVPGGNIIQGGLEMASASMDMDEHIHQAASLMGSDVRHLQAGSPAFKQYIQKELPEIYGDRAIGYGISLAGGAIAMGLVGMTFGLPAGIPGLLVGGIVGVGGSIAAGYVKEALFPSSYNSFLNFASQLQNMGQQGQMPPEAAFVALVINMPDSRSKKNVIASLPRSLGVKDEKGLIKLLNTDNGREALRQLMHEHDADVRAGVGAMSVAPQMTISEHFARLVNNRKIAGVDLLHQEKTTHIGNLIAMMELQQMQQSAMQPQASVMPQNLNQHLPNVNPAQRGM